jgi:hypothetical protein
MSVNSLASGKMLTSIAAAVTHVEDHHATPVSDKTLEIVEAKRIGFEPYHMVFLERPPMIRTTRKFALIHHSLFCYRIIVI